MAIKSKKNRATTTKTSTQRKTSDNLRFKFFDKRLSSSFTGQRIVFASLRLHVCTSICVSMNFWCDYFALIAHERVFMVCIVESYAIRNIRCQCLPIDKMKIERHKNSWTSTAKLLQRCKISTLNSMLRRKEYKNLLQCTHSSISIFHNFSIWRREKSNEFSVASDVDGNTNKICSRQQCLHSHFGCVHCLTLNCTTCSAQLA